MKNFLLTGISLLILLLSQQNTFGQGISNDSFKQSCKTIITRIATDERTAISDTKKLDKTITVFMSQMKDNGEFVDVEYMDMAHTNWKPILHLDRVKQMAIAYTSPQSKYYQSDELHTQITNALEYWITCHPKSSNWWYNEIAAPRRLGRILVLLKTGKKQLTKDTENDLLLFMEKTGNTPLKRTGANKTDIAMHWLYRGCLQQNKKVVDLAVQEIFYPLRYTTEEGIQYDNSYFQHGKQLYIGGYAPVLLSCVVNAASYFTDTDYALSGEPLEILSKFIRKTYLKFIRGKFICYNAIGRGIGRENGLNSSGTISWLKKLELIDKINANEYKEAIAVLSEKKPLPNSLQTDFTHYYTGDYSLFQNKDYSFGIRLSSERTSRCEQGNEENLKGYYLSDGSTVISTAGNEYENIFPVWDWQKIPGVTCTQAPEVPEIKRPWGVPGESDFAGGLSDGCIGVSAYKMNRLKDKAGVSANKAWFFFGKEVVCLGSNISTNTSHEVNTTVNQCLLKGEVIYSEKGKTVTAHKEDSIYSKPIDWVLHNRIGYFFPESQQVSLQAKTQSGNWHTISHSERNEIIQKDVFTLWLAHGGQQQTSRYSYIVVPQMANVATMQKYRVSEIEILENSDSLQAVRHKKQNIIQLVFYRPGNIVLGKTSIQTNRGCIIMLIKREKKLNIYVADPSHKLEELAIRIKHNGKETINKQIDFSQDGYHKGKTHTFQIKTNFPI